ncbi:MAG TPA: ABC transporter ATP-binding protein [Pyrinomonadaceae bacterium]|jgi:ABC-2 type transport system ATP-binding protein|nr:ABC transporter ATP-binding protein [Pyrinomonadaceae bacterium]
MSVVIDNLSKTYRASFPRLKRMFGVKTQPDVEALKNVSFSIEEGEIFGLIGRNGAGKTTLTKIIATLVQPDGGAVAVNGFDSVRDEVKVRSLIGLATAEERSFYWRLTATQNMMFFARLYGMNDNTARARIAELFEELDLADLAKRRFAEMSTGNKQRLAVARALLARPPVLLLDEPTRSLDPLAAAKMRELILRLSDNSERKVSILLTSHNLTEVEELCRRVAIISKGEIRATGTPDELRRGHKQTQQVKITCQNIAPEKLAKKLEGLFPAFTMAQQGDSTLLSFTRGIDDDVLGKAIALLNENGAKVVDVKTEQATLLDVLEEVEK